MRPIVTAAIAFSSGITHRALSSAANIGLDARARSIRATHAARLWTNISG